MIYESGTIGSHYGRWKDLVGAKVRVDIQGMTLTAYVRSESASAHGGGGVVRFGGEQDGSTTLSKYARDLVLLEVLERPTLPDDYPDGTVVRYRYGHNSYGCAVKAGNGWATTNGTSLSWKQLLAKRPLTVLAESKVLD
jgi:hypothetical protein